MFHLAPTEAGVSQVAVPSALDVNTFPKPGLPSLILTCPSISKRPDAGNIVMFPALFDMVELPPAISNIAPGVLVPIPTLPSFLTKRSDVSDEFIIFKLEVALVLPEPFTTSRDPSVVVPIPTLAPVS